MLLIRLAFPCPYALNILVFLFVFCFVFVFLWRCCLCACLTLLIKLSVRFLFSISQFHWEAWLPIFLHLGEWCTLTNGAKSQLWLFEQPSSSTPWADRSQALRMCTWHNPHSHSFFRPGPSSHYTTTSYPFSVRLLSNCSICSEHCRVPAFQNWR